MLTLNGADYFDNCDGDHVLELYCDGSEKKTERIAYPYICDDGKCLDRTGNNPGDTNNDKKVDIQDLIIVAQNFGAVVGFPPEADLDDDEKIGIKDLLIVIRNFGRVY